MHTPSRRLTAVALLGLALPALAQKKAPVPAAGTASSVGPAGIVAAPLLSRASLEIKARQAVIAEDFVFKATLKIERPSPLLAGRAIKFTLDGAAACTGTTDGAGVATCHFKIPPMAQGFHDYQAKSATGDGLTSAKAEAKILIGKAPTKLTVYAGGSGDSPLTPGDTISVSAHLTRALDGSPMDGKPVSFAVNGASLGTATTVVAVAKKSWKVPGGASGPQKFEAFFVTDDSYVGTSAAVTKGVARKAYLNVLESPDGIVGKSLTARAQIAKVAYLPGLKSPAGGLSGRTLKFIFDHTKAGPTDSVLGWNWSATTDAQGVATVTGVPKATAHRIRVRLEPPTDGWTAEEVARPISVGRSESVVSAPARSGRIGTSVALKVHVTRKTDGAPRMGAKIHVTKIAGKTPFPEISFSTDPNGDGTHELLLTSQMGIGNHTMTVVVDGDATSDGRTITVPLAIQPSA